MIKEDKIKALGLIQILYQNKEISTEQKTIITKYVQCGENKERVEGILKSKKYGTCFGSTIAELLSMIHKEENNNVK